MIQTISAGNGLRILLMPPSGTTRIVLLRKDADTFTGHDDADAWIAMDGTERHVVDVAGLYNGVKVYYRAYYWNGSAWSETATVAATPAANFADASVDALSVVRDRLELGLQVYVERTLLAHPYGRIPVMTASPLFEEVPLPVVTVHVANDSSELRFIGDAIGNDVFSADDLSWATREGWFSRVQLTVVGWSLNADERAVLRNAMKTVLMANMTVFDAAGLMQIDLQFSDQEDFQSYSAPVYQAICSFTCYAPSVVESVDPAIREVVSTLIE